MKKTMLVLALSFCVMPLAAAEGPKAELKIVESVPAETVYGSSLAARPREVWLEMINSAKKTLDIEQFYIADKEGEAMSPVLEAVKAAAKRGVKVRLIADSVMMGETSKALPALKEAGVNARVIDFKKKIGGVQHSKFFIADGEDSFIGSQNFDWRSLSQIHEIGVRIKSAKAAADLELVFDGDWALAGGTEPKRMFGRKKTAITAAKPEKAALDGQEVSYSLSYSPVGYIPRGADQEITELLKLLASAKHTVRGQVMTYALLEHGSKRWPELDSAFRKAAARGVKVELIFADWGMGGKADRDIKALSKTDNIKIRISSLPQLSTGFVPYSRVEHCKYLSVDGETAYITTSNWGPGYFLSSRGVGVVIKGAAAASVLEDIFSKAWDGPYVQPVDPLKEYQPVKRN
ncbi:MAG: phospholipase D-like domain-containing protein [Elusimicrobia bacterium]|nr:phospholipase D-like domain-containing protein [Elusimicrobiota bacterium]